jgi:hypothetical protein
MLYTIVLNLRFVYWRVTRTRLIHKALDEYELNLKRNHYQNRETLALACSYPERGVVSYRTWRLRDCHTDLHG